MAYKRNNPIDSYDLGIDQSTIPNEGITGHKPRGLYWLSNVRWHPAGYYINDRGWEAQKVFDDSTYTYTSGDFEPTRFLDIWDRHDHSERYYFYERDGQLIAEWGNGLASDTRLVLRNTGFRHLPEPTEVGTQMTAVGGKWCLFSNGHDEPFKFFKGAAPPGTIDTQFSWRTRPPAPIPIPIVPTYDSGGNEDLGNDAEGTAAIIPGTGIAGITNTGTIGNISFAYKIRWVSDTGSVSPLSDPGLLDFTINMGDDGRYIAWIRVGQGPDNTIGFDLFRTQQRSQSDRNSGTISNDFFFVKRVYGNAALLVSDHTPDAELSILAPDIDEDAVPIDSTFNYSAVWDDRVWIGGGPVYAAQVRYSASGLPETFPALNYFNYSGGNVTALVEFNHNLFVFQENAINVISKDGVAYKSTRITSQVGTSATNTIKAVPGGLVFLASDGFYMITLASDSQAQPTFSVIKISQAIEPTLSRLNTQALQRATACYNRVEKEYWCHMPVDGDVENTFGCVLHDNGEWSFREDITSSPSSMQFGHLAFDGYHTIIGGYPIDQSAQSSIEDGSWLNVGLQVWSASPNFGTLLTSGSRDESAYSFTQSTNTRVPSIVETVWMPMFSEYTKEQTLGIEVMALGTGYQEITPVTYIDYQWHDPKTQGAVPLQDSDYLGTTEGSPVFDTATRDPIAVWDTSIIGEWRPITLRWDLRPRHSRALKMKWSSSDLFAIKSLRVIYQPTATAVSSAIR